MCRRLAVTQHLRGISTPAKNVQQDKRNLALADLRQILPAPPRSTSGIWRALPPDAPSASGLTHFTSPAYAVRPQQFLNFFPLPQGQGSFRPAFAGLGAV